MSIMWPTSGTNSLDWRISEWTGSMSPFQLEPTLRIATVDLDSNSFRALGLAALNVRHFPRLAASGLSN